MVARVDTIEDRIASGVEMSAVIARFVLHSKAKWQPSVMQVRTKVRWTQSKLYQEPHVDEKLLRAAVEPVFVEERLPAWQTCSRHNMHEPVLHPYIKLLSQDFRHELQDSRMMLVYQMNWIKRREYIQVRNRLFKEGYLLLDYSPFIAKVTFENTKYANLIPLLLHDTVYILSKDSSVQSVAKLLKHNKTMPQFILLCAVIDEKIMSRDEVQEYSALPSIHMLRAQLVHTLSQVASTLPHTLLRPASDLSINLSQHAKAEKSRNKLDD